MAGHLLPAAHRSGAEASVLSERSESKGFLSTGAQVARFLHIHLPAIAGIVRVVAQSPASKQSPTASSLPAGVFRITEMSYWDITHVEACGPAYVRICKNGSGHFAFEHIRGELLGHVEVKGGLEGFIFRWEGLDDDMPVDGRGYASSTGSTLVGAFIERGGRTITFTAQRVKSLPRRPSRGLFRL